MNIKWSRFISLLWLAACGSLAAFFLLRPDPAVRKLEWFPSEAARWVDTHWDLRTLVMTLGIVALPSLLLIGQAPWRRRFLFAILVLLLLGETGQLFIETRSFSWADIVYTLVGIVIAETVASCGDRILGSFRRNSVPHYFY
ncbi:MAG: hypothetical protein Q7Q71_05845 [Verrucomicrobiota bacterium JB023]|nr:hypothetical protein [Verrucomicrobiota bacterium JB023]